MRSTNRLLNPEQARAVMGTLWMEIRAHLQMGQELEIEVRKPKRSPQASRRMWAMLDEIAEQVDWHGQKLSSEDWKNVFSSSLKKQRAVPGIDGGFVVLGTETSKMTTEEMCDLMALMESFGAVHDVEFSGETA